MFYRDTRGVAEPGRGHVKRKRLSKLGFPSRSHVLEWLCPWNQPSFIDDPLERRSQIRFVAPRPIDHEQ